MFGVTHITVTPGQGEVGLETLVHLRCLEKVAMSENGLHA